MRANASPLVEALRRPASVAAWDLAKLDLVVRQARQANLLARLAILLDGASVLDRLDPAPRAHFRAARILADKHRRDVHWEIRCLHQVLAPVTRMVLLKGAAYVLADLPAARGRVFSDIDVMVPKPDIGAAEQALLHHGWFSVNLDAYDQRYYRTWMHQIPPLMHFQRQTVVDVHHTIVPETARSPVDAGMLFSAARAVPGFDNLHVLAPADMVLHSAVHLFNGSEYEIGLRDLCDIHDLLEHFGAAPGFWDALWHRAIEIGLRTPLYLAVRYTRDVLGTAMPESFVRKLDAYGRGRPSLRLLRPLVSRAVRPVHRGADDALTGFARWLLYVRGHYLRMPAHLLVPHLIRKAVQGRLKPE